MRFFYLSLFVSCFFITSCQKKSPLEQLLSCEKTGTITLDKLSTDFNKSFSIETSKYWKTNLYYDDFQSSIMTADTTQALTKAFIFEAAMYSGALEFTADFNANILANIDKKEQTVLQENYFKWQEKPAYYSLIKGLKNKHPYQELTIYINNSETAYIKAQIQVYGSENIQERLCNALSLFDTLKIK